MFKYNNITVLDKRHSKNGNLVILASFDYNGFTFGFDGELNVGKPENLTNYLKRLEAHAYRVVSNSHNSQKLFAHGIRAASTKLDTTTLCDKYASTGDIGREISHNFFKYF